MQPDNAIKCIEIEECYKQFREAHTNYAYKQIYKFLTEILVLTYKSSVIYLLDFYQLKGETGL